MGGLLGILFGGPAFGLIGSLFGQVFKLVNAFVEAKEKARQREHELRLLKMNIEARGEEMESEALIAQVEATAEMLKGSYKHDASYGVPSPWARNVLRFVRPALTFLVLGLVALIYFIDGEGMDLDTGLAVKERITMSLIMLAEIAFTWWFADRQINKFAKARG